MLVHEITAVLKPAPNIRRQRLSASRYLLSRAVNTVGCRKKNYVLDFSVSLEKLQNYGRADMPLPTGSRRGDMHYPPPQPWSAQRWPLPPRDFPSSQPRARVTFSHQTMRDRRHFGFSFLLGSILFYDWNM